jgi:hypothetical protein
MSLNVPWPAQGSCAVLGAGASEIQLSLSARQWMSCIALARSGSVRSVTGDHLKQAKPDDVRRLAAWLGVPEVMYSDHELVQIVMLKIRREPVTWPTPDVSAADVLFRPL